MKEQKTIVIHPIFSIIIYMILIGIVAAYVSNHLELKEELILNGSLAIVSYLYVKNHTIEDNSNIPVILLTWAVWIPISIIVNII